MGAPSHKSRTTGSGGAGCVSALQRLERPAGAASNESKKVGRGRVGWRGERENAGQRLAQGDPKAAAQQARSGAQPGRGSDRREEGEGVEDIKKRRGRRRRAGGILYLSKAARGRFARLGEAKPKEAEHR